MPRGGVRPGAGRKPGSPNKATQERQALVAAAGPTPLDVMLENMRFAHQHAAGVLAKIMEGEDAANVDSLKELLRFRSMAEECAKDAAPYVHPKLASIEHTGKDGGPIETKNVSDIEAAQRVAYMLGRAIERKRAEADASTKTG